MISPQQLLWARIATGILALLIVNQGVGLQRLRRKAANGANWPSTKGEIIGSDVKPYSVDRETGDDRSSVSIRYSYVVNGKTHKGERIGWGNRTVMLTPAAQSLSARYPVGASVPVFYDPGKPDSALLEPRGQSKSTAMMPIVLFLIVFCAIEISLLPLALLGYNPTTAGGMPLFGFLLPLAGFAMAIGGVVSYLRLRRMAVASRHWPKTAGKIVSAAVTTIRERDPSDSASAVDRTTKKYRADILYAYRVGQNGFVATAISMGWAPLYGLARDAEAVVAGYPAGAKVDVYYDPANPEIAVLQPDSKDGVLMPLIFALIFGVGSAAFVWVFATMRFG
jgi:hypothetical protein